MQIIYLQIYTEVLKSIEIIKKNFFQLIFLSRNLQERIRKSYRGKGLDELGTSSRIIFLLPFRGSGITSNPMKISSPSILLALAATFTKSSDFWPMAGGTRDKPKSSSKLSIGDSPRVSRATARGRIFN